MPVALAVENEKLSFTNTASTEANFESKCKHVTLNATDNCYIAFDRPANTDDFLLLADTMLDITFIEFTKISAIGVVGSGTLYIMCRR